MIDRLDSRASAAQEPAELPIIPCLSPGGEMSCGKQKRRRHPVARLKGNWSSDEDAKLIAYAPLKSPYSPRSDVEVLVCPGECHP